MVVVWLLRLVPLVLVSVPVSVLLLSAVGLVDLGQACLDQAFSVWLLYL